MQCGERALRNVFEHWKLYEIDMEMQHVETGAALAHLVQHRKMGRQV